MSEPRTEAGRRLLDYWASDSERVQLEPMVFAIEDEARAEAPNLAREMDLVRRLAQAEYQRDEARADPELTTAYMVGFEKGKDTGRADLAARIEARLNEWPIGPALREHGWQDAVLAAIREEAEG